MFVKVKKCGWDGFATATYNNESAPSFTQACKKKVSRIGIGLKNELMTRIPLRGSWSGLFETSLFPFTIVLTYFLY